MSRRKDSHVPQARNTQPFSEPRGKVSHHAATLFGSLTGFLFGAFSIAAIPFFPQAIVSAVHEPGGPPEARNCSIPTADNQTTELTAPSAFIVTLDEQRGLAVLTIGTVSPNATCYSVFKSPSPTNPIAFAWDEEAVTVPSQLTDRSGFVAEGRTCYQLYVGNAAGHSPPVERCIDIPASLVPTPEPTPNAPTPEAPGVGTGLVTSTSSSLPRWGVVAGFVSLMLTAGALTFGVFSRNR